MVLLQPASPEKLLEALCEREQIKYLAGVDLFDVMSIGREQAAKDLQRQHAEGGG